MPAPDLAENFQACFHRRWGHLRDGHVRALAWLLDAPDLLDPRAPQWQGRIASLGPLQPHTADWLSTLDTTPAELHAWLDVQPFTRLGRYAEKLMAFYFQRQGSLFAHGLQVRGPRNDTVGEFDFLLWQGRELVHWEFASKFYLLEAEHAAADADAYVGPDLADTLGLKMRKIMERQLALSRHPAAQAVLPQAVARAQALVKGWLFYHGQTPAAAPGISMPHCRGFWQTLDELEEDRAQAYMVLPRLSWLAPAQDDGARCLDGMELRKQLQARLTQDGAPALVALMQATDDGWRETGRGFIVPESWRARAAERGSA